MIHKYQIGQLVYLKAQKCYGRIEGYINAGDSADLLIQGPRYEVTARRELWSTLENNLTLHPSRITQTQA